VQVRLPPDAPGFTGATGGDEMDWLGWLMAILIGDADL
jgi:hypothetical protein